MGVSLFSMVPCLHPHKSEKSSPGGSSGTATAHEGVTSAVWFFVVAGGSSGGRQITGAWRPFGMSTGSKVGKRSRAQGRQGIAKLWRPDWGM